MSKMKQFLTPGVVAGAFAMLAAASVAAGKPALAAFLGDPNTAATATLVVGGIASLVAGLLEGVRKPS
jgi:hypothetical protein